MKNLDFGCPKCLRLSLINGLYIVADVKTVTGAVIRTQLPLRRVLLPDGRKAFLAMLPATGTIEHWHVQCKRQHVFDLVPEIHELIWIPNS